MHLLLFFKTPAILVKDMEEVLEAKIVSWETIDSRWVKMSFLSCEI
jgi:hypothetical protein